MKNNKITPIGLKGREINERMKELMGIKTINENKSTSAVELTKIGPDGNAYAIIRENREWYIKKADKTTGLVVEDFKYIGGLQNKKMEAYPSYSSALKRLNFKFKSLAEAHNFTGEINIVENDNLISEAGFAGFSQHGGNGFMGEINMSRYSEPIEEEKDKDNPWAICTASVGREDAEKYERCVRDVKKQKGIDESISEESYMDEGMYGDDIELSEAEQAIEEMIAREELYGNQHKLDVDNDGEIENSDLASLRGQKNVKEMQGHLYTDDMENQTSNDDAYRRTFDSLSEYSNDALNDMLTNLSRFEETEEEMQLIKNILSDRKTNNIYENKVKKKV
jgi:hypothetical protein